MKMLKLQMEHHDFLLKCIFLSHCTEHLRHVISNSLKSDSLSPEHNVLTYSLALASNLPSRKHYAELHSNILQMHPHTQKKQTKQ